MPDPSPPPPPLPPQAPPSSSSSFFGRRPSLFTGRSKRKGSVAPVSPPAVIEERNTPSPFDRRDSSSLSLPSSLNDSNLRRSVSLRSHDSQISLHQHKSRQSSVTGIASSRTPLHHRVSRSISANQIPTGRSTRLGSFSSTISPQKTADGHAPASGPQHRSRDQGSISSTLEPPPKTPFSSMLSAGFGHHHHHHHHGLKRQDTMASTAGAGGAGGSGGGGGGGGGIAFNPNALQNHIHEIANKRIATLDYLRKLHEGHVHYLQTLSYSPQNLQHIPSLHPAKLGRRATNYLILGASIPPVLDLNAGQPLDYLRALAQLLQEYETYVQLTSTDVAAGTRGRVGAMFKSGMRGVKGRRSSATPDGILLAADSGTANTPTEAHAAAAASTTALDALPLPPLALSHHVSHTHGLPHFEYLQVPNLPFDPDFASVFATLTDVLVDAYADVLMMLQSPEACNQSGVGDAFAKADKVLRKIMVEATFKEFGEQTRWNAKGEVAGVGKVVLAGLM